MHGGNGTLNRSTTDVSEANLLGTAAKDCSPEARYEMLPVSVGDRCGWSGVLSAVMAASGLRTDSEAALANWAAGDLPSEKCRPGTKSKSSSAAPPHQRTEIPRGDTTRRGLPRVGWVSWE